MPRNSTSWMCLLFWFSLTSAPRVICMRFFETPPSKPDSLEK